MFTTTYRRFLIVVILQASTVAMDSRASWRHAQTLLSFVSFLHFSNQSMRTTKFWTVLTETLITEQGGNVTTISSEDGTVSPEQRWLPDRFNSQSSASLNGEGPFVVLLVIYFV